MGEDGARKGQLALDAGHFEVTVIDDEVLDQRQLERLAGLGAVAEVPVGVTGLVLEHDDVRPGDFQARQDDMAIQRRQHLGLDIDLVDGGEVVLRRAVDTGGRLADMQSADRSVGRKAEQVDAQMPVDACRPVGLGRYDAAQGRLGPVPIGIAQEDDDGDESDQDNGDG